MNKRLLVMMGSVLLLINCAAPNRIKSNENLFADIAAIYKLPDYKVILKTKDSIFYLTNVRVTPDGSIIAEESKAPFKIPRFKKYQLVDGKKSLLFKSNEKSGIVIRRIVDSTGKEPTKIIFTRRSITQVNTYENQNGPNKRFAYDKLWWLKSLFKILLVTLGMGAVAIAAYAIYIIVVIITWFFGGGACYIATMVYGSYDAPEVLILRKYRDEKLVPYFWGRVFIGIYYTLSPVFVKVFKHHKPVNRFVKGILDPWVGKLRAKEMIIGNAN